MAGAHEVRGTSVLRGPERSEDRIPDVSFLAKICPKDSFVAVSEKIRAGKVKMTCYNMLIKATWEDDK